MNVNELYITLEVYAHLRDLPQYAALKAAIETKLRDENDALTPAAPVVKPVAIPASTPRAVSSQEPSHHERGR